MFNLILFLISFNVNAQLTKDVMEYDTCYIVEFDKKDFKEIEHIPSSSVLYSREVSCDSPKDLDIIITFHENDNENIESIKYRFFCRGNQTIGECFSAYGVKI
jgi:hypothetical protein